MKEESVPVIYSVSPTEIPRPFWSVMIPTYNPPPGYLEETLRCVLAQDSGELEMQIEVVDDCSPNVDVAALVKSVGRDRIKVSRTPGNLGLAGCWNTCIENSRGEWVHILHQDDLVLPDFYLNLRRLINAYPNAGAAFSRYDLVDLKGAKIFEQPTLQAKAGPIEHPAETLAIKNEVQCPAIVVRRSAYESVGGYDGSLAFTVDWEMWIRIAAEFEVLYHPEVLASFRVQPGSETSRLAATGETVRDSMKMIERYTQYIRADRTEAVQIQARQWVCNLALQKAHAFLKDRKAAFAMSQLYAALAYERRTSFWIDSLECWLKATFTTGKFLMPPLPFLPASWFRHED